MTIDDIKTLTKMGADFRYPLCQYFLSKVWDWLDVIAVETVYEDGQIREIETHLDAEFHWIEGIAINQPWNFPIVEPPHLVGDLNTSGSFGIDQRTGNLLQVCSRHDQFDHIFDAVDAMASAYARHIMRKHKGGQKIYTVPQLYDTDAAYDIFDGLYVKLEYSETPEYHQWLFSTMFLLP